MNSTSTTTQTTGECEDRSVTDLVALETFMLGLKMQTHASLASLHAPQVRALTTSTIMVMVTPPWRWVSTNIWSCSWADVLFKELTILEQWFCPAPIFFAIITREIATNDHKPALLMSVELDKERSRSFNRKIWKMIRYLFVTRFWKYIGAIKYNFAIENHNIWYWRCISRQSRHSFSLSIVLPYSFIPYICSLLPFVNIFMSDVYFYYIYVISIFCHTDLVLQLLSSLSVSQLDWRPSWDKLFIIAVFTWRFHLPICQFEWLGNFLITLCIFCCKQPIHTE